MASVALDFAIIGAQKAGTTFVQACLREHPAICMPRGETPFFEDPDFQTTPFAELQELVEQAADGQIFGIKRPSYLALPAVAERIKAVAPDARLVVILRHPVDRAVSAYFHNIKYGFLPCVPIERGLRALLAGAETVEPGRAADVLELGFYGRQLRAYLRTFAADRVLVVLHDELAAAPLATIARIYGFLGVDADYVPRNASRRINTGTYSLVRLRLWALFNRYRYTYDESRTRLRLKDQTRRDRVAAFLVGALQKLAFSGRPPRRVALSADLANALRALYRDDVRELKTLGIVRSDIWPDLTPGVGDTRRLAARAATVARQSA